MMFLRIMMVALSLVTLVGCASTNDVAINESYDNASIAHDEAASEAVQIQAQAISEASNFECTAEMTMSECVLGSVIVKMSAAREIASLNMHTFTLARSKTGVDVQIKGLEVAGKGIPFATMGYVSVKAIEQEQGETTYNNDGDVIDSGNRTENHSTTAGDNNTVDTNSNDVDEETTVPENVEEDVEEEE